MNKVKMKLIPFFAAAVLAGACVCIPRLSVVCYAISVFSLFIVDLASDRISALAVNVLFVAAAGFSGGVICAVFMGLLAAFIAELMSEVIKRTADFGYTLAAGVAGFSASFMIIDLIFRKSDPDGGLFGIFGTVVDSLVYVFSENIGQLSGTAGYTAENIEMIRRYLDVFSDSVKLMLPGIIITAGGILCAAVLIASRLFVGRMPVPPLSGLRAPRNIVYAFSLLYIFVVFVPEGTALVILSNVLFVLSCFMILCGFSVVKYFTDKIKPKLLSYIVFVMSVPLCFTMSTVLAFAGMADGIFKFRSLINEKK